MFLKTRYLVLLVVIVPLIYSCKSKKQGQTPQERQDSLAQVHRRQRRDSLAQVKRDSVAKMKAGQDSLQQSKQKSTISFSKNGRYAIRLGSWRSKVKASKQVQLWENRGYSSASVSRYKINNAGDVWFRVQIGRVKNRSQAQRLQDQIQQKYHQKSWIEDIS